MTGCLPSVFLVNWLTIYFIILWKIVVLKIAHLGQLLPVSGKFSDNYKWELLRILNVPFR